VVSFYAAIMAALWETGIHIAIDEMPNELPEPVRFSEDTKHASYDPPAVRRFLQILVNADRVFKQFRTGFLGKASPVHFFWGSFDLAVTRFSDAARRAIPAACLTSPTTSPAKPIPTRRAAPVFGPAAARSIIRRSIPTPIPNRQASAPRRCGRMLRSSASFG